MNISFNKSKVVKKTEDPIKEQINFFKLKVDEKDRYLSSIDIFNDDSKIMCTVEDKQIELTYDRENRIVDLECYEDEELTNKLKLFINSQKSISENLILINKYLESIHESTDKYIFEKISPIRDHPSAISRRTRDRLAKIFEHDDEDVLKAMNSSDSDDSLSENGFCSDSSSDSEEEAYTKQVKPVKFDFTIITKKLVPDLSDDIILTEDNDSDNYIPFDIINNSKKTGKNATVHQIVNEINKVIKQIKNVKVKPINTVFEISIENKFGDNTFTYNLNIPLNYPFVPPTISVKSNCNQSFTFCLNKAEIINDTKWNPSTTLSDIINGIYKNIERLGFENINSKSNYDEQFYKLSTKLLELTNCEPMNYKDFSLNFDFLKIQDKKTNKGIGYDHSGPAWDVNAYIRMEEEKNTRITNILRDIVPLIKSNKEFIKETCIIPYIRQYLCDVSLIEVEKRKTYYETLFEAFNEIYKLNDYNSEFNIQKISDQRDSFVDYPNIQKNIPIIEKKSVTTNTDDYVSLMSTFAFGQSDMVTKRRFKFMDQTKHSMISPDFVKRVTNETRSLMKNLPISETSSIFLRVDESNMSIMKFLVVPHPDTPYAYGCFEFDMYLPYNYPSNPPHVEIITTGGGSVRFNPNLYADGKVCLSLLGTWSGNGGEKWNSSSTILQVLLSIQSLIFCEEPYFNEPGYERDRGNESGKKRNNEYNEPIRFQTMKLGMLEQLRNPTYGFEDVIKNHFRMKKNDIIKKLDEWEKISINKIAFNNIYSQLKVELNKL